MLKLEQALLVEGKYDAARLANLVDGTILTTDGFRVFKDGALQKLLKRIAAVQGLIILTDSDAAGFKIRHFVTGLVGAENVLQAYVPAVPGKESRKAEPGKEGLLGVEGVNDDLILQGLETALTSKTTCQQKTAQLRPTNGRPCASSLAPGPSPTKRTSASVTPCPNTTWVRVSHNPQRWHARHCCFSSSKFMNIPRIAPLHRGL